MAYVDRDGVQIFYEAAGDGPVVLLTHGYSATAEMWRGQVKPLVGAGFRVVVWDMRGHGASDSPDDPAAYSEAATVGDMAAVLDAVGADQAVIGGLSLGGFMSLAFHLAHPGRTGALMLFDTGPGFKKDEPRQAWNEMARKMAAAYDKRGLAALGSSAEVRVSTHRSPAGLAHAGRGMLTQQDARVIESLPSIAVPTLVLVGSEDKAFLSGIDYMAAKIPGATKVVLQGAGHAANIDDPDGFNRAVLDFLNRSFDVR